MRGNSHALHVMMLDIHKAVQADNGTAAMFSAVCDPDYVPSAHELH